MRRIVVSEPLSKAAAWSRSLAFFAMAVAIIGVVLARGGLDATAAMAVEGGAMVIAALAVLCAVAAMIIIWRTGYRGIGHLLAALVLAPLVLAYPGFMIVAAARTPWGMNVSTDPANPPRFATSAQAIAARGGVTPPLPSPAQQDLQRRLYPDLQPIVVDLEAIEAHRLVAKLVAARHWRIVDDELPLGRLGVGRIDAVAKTRVMGFPADVTIRIKAVAGQSSIDIRSVSRTPWQEPGSNVARIQALAADIDDQASEEK